MIIAGYSWLEPDDIRACLVYARRLVGHERIEPLIFWRFALKIVLDSCVWGGAIRELLDNGHDVIWVGQGSIDPGDKAILRTANQNNRVLVTCPVIEVLRKLNLKRGASGVHPYSGGLVRKCPPNYIGNLSCNPKSLHSKPFLVILRKTSFLA